MGQSTPELITQAYKGLIGEIPSFAKLKLVLKLELRGRGDVQIFRVQLPGPQISKGEPDDASIEVEIPRASFNALADDAKLSDWHTAWEEGKIKAQGNSDYLKLIGTVVTRHEARARLQRG